MEEVIAVNRRNYYSYRKGLEGLPGISVTSYAATERNNYQYIVVEVDPALSLLNRDELVAVLASENVLARKYFWPGCHRMEPYRSLQPHANLLLPETERIAPRVMVLPTGQSVSNEAVDVVCRLLRDSLASADQLRSVLAAAAATT